MLGLTGHAETARALFEKGYNCSQSVFAAFCDKTGLDMETALRLSSSFGGGMGRLREVCGALTGVFMAAGLLFGYSDPSDDVSKAEHYKLVQDFAFRFREKNGSYICRELLGLAPGADSPVPEARTAKYYQARPCADLVACAAEMLDELIQSKQNENCETGE